MFAETYGFGHTTSSPYFLIAMARWKEKEDTKRRRPVPGTDGLSCNTCTPYTVKTMSVGYGTPDPNSDPRTEDKSSSAVAHQEGSTA